MTDVFPTIGKTLEWGARRLREQGIENPRLDAEVLLAHCMNTDRASLYRDAKSPLEEGCQKQYLAYITRRAGREPVAYITGLKEFRSRTFNVSPQVLIPRPETETIIEVVLHLYGATVMQNRCLRFLEIGTGSGIVAVSLAGEFDSAWICATDCASTIVAVARTNAQLNRVDHRISFLAGNMLDSLLCRDDTQAFDCIISNPPYLSDDEWKRAQPDIRKFEPARALQAGPDGLLCYRQLIPETGRLLRKQGYLLLEIGLGQSAPVARLIEETGIFKPVATAKDLGGTDRVVIAQKG